MANRRITSISTDTNTGITFTAQTAAFKVRFGPISETPVDVLLGTLTVPAGDTAANRRLIVATIADAFNSQAVLKNGFPVLLYNCFGYLGITWVEDDTKFNFAGYGGSVRNPTPAAFNYQITKLDNAVIASARMSASECFWETTTDLHTVPVAGPSPIDIRRAALLASSRLK